MPTVVHETTHLMHRCQQKVSFNFEFSELIEAVSNCEPNDITDPLKVYMHAQKLFKLAICDKTIIHMNLTLQKAIPYAQKI